MKAYAAWLLAFCAVPGFGGQTSMGNGNASTGRLSAGLLVPTVAHLPFRGVLVHTVERGNARTQHTESVVARDAAGRVYQEQRTPQIAGTRIESVQVLFTVWDPVGKVMRTCHPQAMECTEFTMRDVMLARMAAIAVPGREDLGAEQIGGLAVSHTRDVGTRPFAGTANGGAGGPVAETRDLWFSADLETPLRVVLEDAVQGKQETELQITNRGEPDAALFAMPKGYKLVDAPPPIPVQQLPAGVERIGKGVSAPVVLSAPEPEFSEQARREKFSGNVLVSMIVDETGRATDVKVVRGIGHGLDEKAVEAVKGYRFRPAMKAGEPVKVQLNVEVNFQRF